MSALKETHPHTLNKPLDNLYGMLLYSRLPLVDPAIKFLIKDDIPSMHTQVELASGRRIWLHALHPEPPSPTEADSSTERDAELLLVGEAVKDRNEPTIVAGDLNDVAWSYTTTLFQKISGLLDPRKGRGFFNTFNAKNILMRWPLDHVFHSDHFTLVEMERMPAFGSDHFPVFVKLHLQNGAEAEQDEPDLDQEDAEQAEEKIEKATQVDPVKQ
jgi:endonuclease/exonuclease/phosphatase (EEP) superfamily protein YafD